MTLVGYEERFLRFCQVRFWVKLVFAACSATTRYDQGHQSDGRQF